MQEQKKALMIRCPCCKKLTQWEENPYRPFCSEQCRLIDLGKWLDEDYRIPEEKISPEKEETEKD